MNQINASALSPKSSPGRLHMGTPWGQCVHITFRNPAGTVISVGTESHGGIGVLRSVHQMPLHLAGAAIETEEWLWYEEDCAWCCPAIAFPELFPGTQEDAKATMCHWLPDVYAKQFGVMPTSKQSMVVRERELNERLRDNYRVSNVCESKTYPGMGIPEGYVYVRGYRARDGSQATFVVPEAMCVPPLDEIVLDGFQRWPPGQPSEGSEHAAPGL